MAVKHAQVTLSSAVAGRATSYELGYFDTRVVPAKNRRCGGWILEAPGNYSMELSLHDTEELLPLYTAPSLQKLGFCARVHLDA